ncbi:MAG: ABC transporter permease [Bacteroidetes bacterium]|nr:MAG: ABC transporter permease [Bacteroidota bacterium]
MLKNYFKIAWRNLKKNRLYTFVNMAGLTIGLCSCILIGLYIWHENSYDRFNVNADRIVRLTMEYGDKSGSEKVALTGTKPGPEFKRNFPGVEKFCRVIKTPTVVGIGDKLYDEKNFLYADSAFFQMFSFNLLQGDDVSALNAPDKVVVSRKMAEKYFGSVDNAFGKTLRINSDKDFLVSGVAENPPGNSQIQFDFVSSFTSLPISKTEEWYTANYITYLMFTNAREVAPFRTNMEAYMKDVSTKLNREEGSYLTYHLEPLTSVHLSSSLDGLEPNGNITYIYVLGVIAILILAIACINYTNLATAQSAGRGAEIGIRKVLGVKRWQLFTQFISESIILSFISLILAIALTIELIPSFNNVTGKNLSYSTLFHPVPILIFIVLGLLVSFLSGAYPAFILTNSKMVNILKSGFRLSSSGGSLRKSLIVFQFVISVFLFSTTIIILQQTSYIRHKSLGYNKDQVIALPVDRKMREGGLQAFKDALLLNPNIVSVTGAYETPVVVGWGDGITADNGTTKKNIMVNAMPVDLDFVKTLGIKIIAGSDYTLADKNSIDTSNEGKNLHYSFMLNETAVRELGWTPEQAIGKTVSKGVDGTIKAVVKDFHIASLHEPVKPLLIFLFPDFTRTLMVRISGKNIPAAISFLESTWKQRVTHRPFEYHFLDEDYQSLYTAEFHTAQIFSIFSTIAIALACLGLFALAAYATVQRTKEIGIRKVLGASAFNITSLLSADFLKLVLIALVIASPLGWWAAHQWLQDFAYRISIHWWVFPVAGISAILIALVTVSFQAIRAALGNPVTALKTSE